MALSYKARRRLALLILVVGLPLYVMVAVTIAGWIGRPGTLIELAVYVVLGIAWVFPLRPVFIGIGQPDPEAGSETDERDPRKKG